MRKWIILALAVLLVASQTLPCAAAGEELSVSTAQAMPGEYVYLTVSLNKSLVADSIGMTYQYDKSHMEVDTSLCQWSRPSILSDFDQDNNGVWAGVSSEDIQGSICVLAFKVRDKASFVRTEVTVTMAVKNGSEAVGTFTAKGAVTQPCEHTYGPWQTVGALGHSRSCQKCKDAYTESHNWDAGVLSPIPGRPQWNKLTYTCQVCQDTQEKEVPAGSTEENLPTSPSDQNNQSQQPSTPGSNHGQTGSNPGQTGTSGNNQGRPNTPGSSQQGTPSSGVTDPNRDPNHNHGTGDPYVPNGQGQENEIINPDLVIIGGNTQTEPKTDPETNPKEDHDHDHDHTVLQPNEESWVNLVLIAIVAVTLIVAAVLVLKKKR